MALVMDPPQFNRAQRDAPSLLGGHSLGGEGAQQMLCAMTRVGDGSHGRTKEGTQPKFRVEGPRVEG